MDASIIFSLVNMLAMVMWILMIFLPKWKATSWLCRFKLVPLLLSCLYLFYTVYNMINGVPLDFSSLDSVMELFTKESAMMAGWIHYLAFDLLIGMWMIKQNEKHGISVFIMALCLFLTFFLGPVGFLLFSIISNIKK